MRMVLALIATLIAISPGLAREQVRIDSARDLARACRGVDGGAKQAGRRAMVAVTNELLVCLGYMQAIQDFAAMTDKDGTHILGACAPPDTTLRQMVRSFITYSHSHRDELTGSTAEVVVRSLQDAFPCDPTTSTIRDSDVKR